jgi:hypothetical protein
MRPQTMLPIGFVRVGYDDASAMLEEQAPSPSGYTAGPVGSISVLQRGGTRWWERPYLLALMRDADRAEPGKPGIMRTTGLMLAAGYGLAVPDHDGEILFVRTVRVKRQWPELLAAAAAQVRDMLGIAPEYRDADWQARRDAVLEAIASMPPHPADVEMAARRWVAIRALNDDGSDAGTGIYDDEAPEEGWMLALPNEELAQAVVELHNREVDGVLEVLWGRERPGVTKPTPATTRPR